MKRDYSLKSVTKTGSVSLTHPFSSFDKPVGSVRVRPRVSQNTPSGQRGADQSLTGMIDSTSSTQKQQNREINLQIHTKLFYTTVIIVLNCVLLSNTPIH